MKNVRRNDWILIAVGIALLLAACLITAVFIVPVLLPPSGSNLPPATAPTQAIATTCSERWDRIRANGVMVVGTSADYAPFEYYNAQYQIDGFDPQLMYNIGKSLGLQVVFKDFAFEGLSSALMVGQIDAAISAISVTPERQGIVDFSNIYYYGMDAVLAQQNSTIQSIASVNQMAGYRVGVQTGTVYANTLQNDLVATGVMPAANLMQYPRVDSAISDLRAGRIDIVWLDQQPAAEFVQGGGLKFVAQGLNPQSYAIAVCKGATRMVGEINRAISQLSSQGVIGQLSSQYLNLDNAVNPPTPTPTSPSQPTATPAPPPPCVDAMSYVADLNLPDNNMKNPPVMAPGQPFIKGWRIRNSGTCPWTNTYYLGYSSGNVPAAQMGGQDTYIQGTVPPGGVYDMYVNLVAPIVPGVYQGFWQMYSSIRYPFGQRVWVGIQVAPIATVTPKPSQTPSPNISFSATPTTINVGQAVTFNWNVQGAQQVFFYAQGQSWQNYPVPPQASQVVYPVQNTTYELRVIFLNGTTEVRQILIQVIQPPPGAPVINNFDAMPAGQLILGQCTTLNWTVTGQVTQVNLLRNSQPLYPAAPFSGSYQDCPSTTGSMVYTLNASGPGGTTVQQIGITVVPPPSSPPPTATQPPPAPVIESFAVDPAEVQVGGCVNISWNAGGGATVVQIYRNQDVILDGGQLTGTAQDCLSTAGQVIYKLVASNSVGVSVSQEATVNVTAPPTTAPLPSTALFYTNWLLTNYYSTSGGGMQQVLTQSHTSLTLYDDYTLVGVGGCNNYSGPYQLNGTQLTFGSLTVTSMTCDNPPGIMDQENQYFANMAATTRYEITSNQLNLYNASGQLVLQYVAAVQPR